MPDMHGLLKPEERDRINTWLSDKWRDQKCPVCGKDSWLIGDYLARAEMIYPHGQVLGGPYYGFVVVSCANCAYTRLFNAVVMRVSPPEEEAAESESKKEAAGGH